MQRSEADLLFYSAAFYFGIAGMPFKGHPTSGLKLPVLTLPSPCPPMALDVLFSELSRDLVSASL